VAAVTVAAAAVAMQVTLHSKRGVSLASAYNREFAVAGCCKVAHTAILTLDCLTYMMLRDVVSFAVRAVACCVAFGIDVSQRTKPNKSSSAMLQRADPSNLL
jgi:hypothetical protein